MKTEIPHIIQALGFILPELFTMDCPMMQANQVPLLKVSVPCNQKIPFEYSPMQLFESRGKLNVLTIYELCGPSVAH